MNNKGYTMIDMLACLCIMGILFTIGFVNFKGTFSKTQEDSEIVTDNEIINASKLYVLEGNASFINDSVCVNTDQIYEMGYLNRKVDYHLIKLIRNVNTKTIDKVFYVDSCE